MIQEVIISSQNSTGQVHLAPMGVHILEHDYLIMPFQPSTTLNNILATRTAVINYTDDVRIFAGCITGRRDWPTLAARQINGQRLRYCLAHTELELSNVKQDKTRPQLFCKAVLTENHAPFKGFNRAQYAVLEAAILVSRLHMLSREKITNELEYLRIGLDKTAGDNELEAWGWLMQAIAEHNNKGTIK